MESWEKRQSIQQAELYLLKAIDLLQLADPEMFGAVVQELVRLDHTLLSQVQRYSPLRPPVSPGPRY